MRGNCRENIKALDLTAGDKTARICSCIDKGLVCDECLLLSDYFDEQLDVRVECNT